MSVRSAGFPSALFVAALALTLGGCAGSTPPPEHGGAGAEQEGQEEPILAPTSCPATALGDGVTEYRIEPLGWSYRVSEGYQVACGPEHVMFSGQGVAIIGLTLNTSAEPADFSVIAGSAFETAVQRDGGTLIETKELLAGEAETPSSCARISSAQDATAMEMWMCLGWVPLDEERTLLISVFVKDTAEAWAAEDFTLGELAAVFFDNLYTDAELAGEE